MTSRVETKEIDVPLNGYSGTYGDKAAQAVHFRAQLAPFETDGWVGKLADCMDTRRIVAVMGPLTRYRRFLVRVRFTREVAP